MAKAVKGLTDFEKRLGEELNERDKFIGNSTKNAILSGQDVKPKEDDPEWRKQAIEDYKKAHTYSIKDDDGNVVGTISERARDAINSGRLFKYTPQNAEEEKVFSYLRKKQNNAVRAAERREYIRSTASARKTYVPNTIENAMANTGEIGRNKNNDGNTSVADELFSLAKNKSNSKAGNFKPAEVPNLHDRETVKREYNAIKANEPNDNTEYKVPINNNKQIKIKYGIKKRIDSIANQTELSSDKRAKRIDDLIERLELNDDEKKNAISYAGIKKLGIASEASGKDGILKEITQPVVKFLQGTYDAANSASRFIFKDGMKIDGDYTQAYNDAAKYYAENPDQLGNDLFNSELNGLSTPKGDYLRNVNLDKILEIYNDTTKASQFISDAGFRSAGQMLGDMAIASMGGVPDAIGAVKNTVGAVAAGTRAAEIASKIANISPKIKEVAGAGVAAKAANAVIGKVNSVSIGKAIGFLNPLDNPTTALMGISAAQEKYDNLKQMGYDDETAKKNALFTGYVSTITEKMGYDGTSESLYLLKNKYIAGSASASANKNTKKIIRDYLSANVSEGVEEIYNTVLERTGDVFSKVGYVDENGEIRQRKIFGNDGIFDIIDISENFLGGFVGGAVMGSVGLISNIAQHDADTVREYADTVRRQVETSNKIVRDHAKTAGAENITLPDEPDWNTATIDEINEYYQKAVDAHINILSDENVIKNDEEVVRAADNVISQSDVQNDTIKDTSENTSVSAAESDPNSVMHDVKENLSSGGAVQSAENTVRAVSVITDNIIGEFSRTGIDVSDIKSTIVIENLRVISNLDEDIDEKFIRRYADSFALGLERNNSAVYRELSKSGGNIGQMLTDYIIRGRVPQGMKDGAALKRAADKLKEIVQSAVSYSMAAKGKVFNDENIGRKTAERILSGDFSGVSAGNETSVHLTRVGEYYEAYGADAAALARLAGVSTYYKSGDGGRILTAGVPVSWVNENISDGNTYSAERYNADGKERIVLSKNEIVDFPEFTNDMLYEDEETDTTTDIAMADGEVTPVVNALNDTLYPEAKLDILKIAKRNNVSNGLEVFAKNIKAEYENTGTIEKFSGYFKDDGKKVIKAITGNTPKDIGKKNKIVRTKKADWPSHDVVWFAPNSKTVIAYSTRAASDFIEALVDDNPAKTISEIRDMINYDEEAKRVLQKYIDSGFGDDIASEHFSHRKSVTSKTETPDSVSENTNVVENKTDSVTETPENESAVPYTDKEKQNWENSNTIIVYESDEQFESFVERVLNNEDTHKKIYFGKIPDATAQMVLDKTGVDVSGHNIALKGYEIRKILLTSHGDEEAEATRGQEPITTDDLKNIPSVITNPDDVNLSEKEYEGKPALLFEKTIDGKNYVVAYVSRKHHDIAIQTMYKKRSLATAENADALSPTPETTSSTASNNIISQDNDIVNSSARNDTENDTLNLIDKCELIATTHTKTGNDIWVVTLKDRISPEEYKDLSSKVKSVGGYYSRFTKTPDGKAIPGFVFKTEPGEKELKVFNDFFGYTEETTPAETQSAKVNDIEPAKADSNTEVSVSGKELYRKLRERYGNAVTTIRKSYTKPISDAVIKDLVNIAYTLKRTKILSNPNFTGSDIVDSEELSSLNSETLLWVMAVTKSGFYDIADVMIDVVNGKVNSAEAFDKIKNLIINNLAYQKITKTGLYSSENTSSEAPADIEVNNADKPANNENILKNKPDSDTMVSEKTKEDFKVGDILEFDGEQWKCVNIDSTMIDFENVDKNAFQPELSVILPYELFKEKTDYTVIKESAENVESQSEVLARESGVDGGRLHTGVNGTAEQETTEEDDGQHRKNSRETLSESTDTDGNRPDVRNDSERVYGRNDAEDAVSETSGNGTELTKEAPETIDTVDKFVEKKRPSNKNNFIITDDIAADFDNTRPSAEDNIAAIELLLALENEGRPATAEEKKILAKYKGWGGIDTRNVSWALRQKMLNLFNGEQLRNMQTSTSSAFFTPTGVIDAMYNGLKRMGFKGGNVLETSMGVGNFFGRMPSAMSAKSALTGVELESYTARIAQYLYPGATVINKPFQDVAIKNSSFDMVIGNVPFGNEKIRYGKKSYALHNYFIISSLDKVRDGGVVAVITSAGTLDSYGMDARQAIMDRADVVACYKLPAGVFSRNASTDVQTDLLILRKRADGAKPVGDSILNVTTTAGGLRLNEYFVKNPQNILGTLAKGTNAWGEITTVLDDGNFYDKLNKAMGKLPKGLISGNIDLKPIETIVTTSSKPRFFEKDGKIYADDGAGTATAIANGTKSQIVRDYMAVRDAYKELLAAYSNGETVKNADGTYSIRDVSDADIKSLRESLSKAYENFAKKHGAITGDGKKKLSFKTNTNRDNTFLEADADYYLVSGLEKYNTKAKQIEKSELFEKDTLKKKRITSVDTASDALIVSLNESGKVDFARMQELTGKTEKQLAEELKGEIVFTPDGDYVLTDVYLSGNIYEKLEKVKGKPEFKEQQEMLERVIPTPKDASSINIKLGANYIDTEYVEQFSREVFHERISVSKNSAGTWTVDGAGRSRYGDILNVKYGCEKFNAIQLLEKILNDSEITATDTLKQNGTSVTVYNPKMTEVARQKAEDIKLAFENWIFRDSERRTAIVDKYNRMYNNYRPLDFARIAEKLSFESMDEDLRAKLYPHQKKGIARALFGGNVLFAHGVGTGKTFEMIASVMEAKRMGIVNKTAMVVPNNKVVDFKNDIAQAYPNAKVLVIDTANKKRQTMLGLVNSNDWDIVLVGKNTFTKIPVGAELQANYINEQVEELDKQITEAQFDRNTSKREMNRLTKLRDGLLRKLETVNSETKRDENGIEFEKLGFDCICVDEAHNYKSIITPSRLNIKGLSKGGSSQQANDMLMKLDYMRSIDGKIIFGTGTPITNTVSEIYNMMRMVRPDILEDAGIHSLDEWVNTFANIETQTEVGIDGRIKDKSTQIIKSFFNATEMIGMYRQFADVVFTDDVVKDLPSIEFIPVEIEGTEVHRAVQQAISKAIATAKRSESLSVYGKVMTMGSAAALDTRMLAGADSEYNPFKDYSVEELEYENSKVNVMCNYVLDNYKSFADIKGTQLIFCDGGAGTGDVYSFNVHKDIRQKLIELGIPENEIVIMKNQNDAQLEELYAKVNSGEVRVLIGTSAKMAEGLNVQERVVAIHYPTVTYNPADLEQSMARGRRKGNINKKVKIYRYLQGNTFDSYKWQALERKGEMINRALRGEAVDELEDVTADIDPATAMAITSGNPLVKEKIDIDKEVKRLKVLKQNYMSEHYRYEDAVAKNPGQISQLTEYAQRIEQDIALRDKHSNKAEISVKGKTFEKQTEANKAFAEAVKIAPKNGQYTKLGTYNGFDIMFKGDTGGMNYSVVLKGANEYSVEYAGNGNNIARFAGVLNRLDAELTRVREKAETLKTDLEFAKQEVQKPFEKENELTEALEKQKDITYRYEHYGEKTAAAANAETEETESTDTVHSSKDIAENDSISRWTTERVDGNKDSKVNIADIVKGIRDKFGIPVATGKVTDREATGIYKNKPETIRTRIANNLPTISHELGHHLNKKYDLSKLESVKELRKVVSEEFLKQYPANAKNSEAVAEFIRIYLKNTNDANRLCPDFYSDFISTLSKEDLKSLNEIASSVNEYLSYNISERYDAAIVSSQKKEKLSFRDKWHKWYSDWVDAFHPQKQAVDYVEDVTGQTLSGKNNAYILATNSLNAHAVANFLICEGFRDLDGNIVDAKSFVDSIGMVDSKNVKLLDKYLVLRHSLEWIAPEQEDVTAKRVFADDTLENVEEIKNQIAEIEEAHPEIKTAAENLYEYQNNVIKHFVIPAGGMTEEMLSTLNRKYPSYVPFYRAVGKKSGFAKGTFANQRSPIMRAKGSGALIISPTESIIRNTEKMIKFAMRNQVMGMWADYADTVDGFGQFMEKVEPDMIPHFTDITSQKERFTDALQQAVSSGEDYFAVSDLFDEIFGNAVADFTPVANANKKIVTVLKAGTPSYYQIHDDAFYNSVAELSPQQTSGLLRLMNAIMQPMKLLITQNNPIFAATNALRDFGTAYKLSEINNPVTFATQYIKALGGIIANSESYKQYKAMGGGYSSELSANIESISKTLRKVSQKDMGKARRLAYSIFRHPVETVASINDAIESVPRFAEFQRTLKADGDLQEAIFNASDITTNFKRSGKGDTAKATNKIIMFNNAAIQGLDKTFRTITAKDPKKRYKTLLKWLLHALIMGILGYLYNKEVDEEGYKNLSSYKKNNFYNYAIGDGKFISLPKPRENALLDTFTERTIEYLFGENENAFYDFGSYLGSQLLPPMLPDTLDPVDAVHSVLGSTVLGGLVDVGFNQDFKGTPIEGAYDKYIPSNERYSESTSKLAYELGQTKLARYLDMSPKKIDHLISSYTGILGQANKALFPMSESRRDTSFGLRNKFISDSNYSTDVLNRLYENQEKAEKAFNYSGSVSDAIEYEKNSVITSYISGMNKAVKALPEEEQRNGRAYLLKNLNSWNYENTTSQSNMLNSIDGSTTVSKNVIFDELPSSSLEWTVDKQKYVYQMTPQEYHKYISEYLAAIENARKQYGSDSIESCEMAKEAAKEYMSKYKKNVLKKQYLGKATAKTE